MKIKAKKPFSYAGKRKKTGEEFTVSPKNGRVLIAIGKAEAVAGEEEKPKPKKTRKKRGEGQGGQPKERKPRKKRGEGAENSVNPADCKGL